MDSRNRSGLARALPPRRNSCGVAGLIELAIDGMTFESEWVANVGVDGDDFCSVFICRNRSIARSRRWNAKSLFSTRLFAQRPTSCFC